MASASTASLDELVVNTIRTLSMDAVQAADSGHPGTPMALAPVAYKLWADYLNYDPNEPLWPNRDRFVLSCGHASMLLYSLIHLAGVSEVDANGKPTRQPSLPLEELKRFRQMGSRTPGHPEVGHTAGVETTTGPLGQGCGNSVGMAIAGKWLAARYNRPDHELFDYNVYVLCSDGDLMEGIACEAASLAGHLKLDNLCWIYDDNRITIEGDTDLAFSEDVATRFEGLGWTVRRVDDANDLASLEKGLDAFLTDSSGPTLLIVRSVIAFGSPNKANTAGAHGSPLGPDEIRLTKEAYGWPADEPFRVPVEATKHFRDKLIGRSDPARQGWNRLFAAYKSTHAELAAELELLLAGKLPVNWDAKLPTYPADTKGLATRASSGKALNAIAAAVPWFIGGSADLAPSTKTLIGGDAGSFSAANRGGRNFHFGIREHGMAAAANGMALCGVRPFVATFFVFSDYLRPSMRLSALMRLGVVYVFTHDSIGVGEDGPTHQPVEQLAACRAIPGLTVIRPGDAAECSEAWRNAIAQQQGPTALVLTRQDLPTLDRSKYAAASGAARGGYVLADAKPGAPTAIIVATGSELSLAVTAYEELAAAGVAVRLVSMPSMELFERQDLAYRESVLPRTVTARVGVEAGVRQGWDRYLGPSGAFIGLCDFGTSAPCEEIYAQRGITSAAIVAAVRQQLGG